MTLIEVQNMLRDLCDEVGSIRKWSAKNRMSFSYISRVVRGDLPPSDKILKKMGLKREYTFKKIPDYRN